jgi:hypothetical protein
MSPQGAAGCAGRGHAACSTWTQAEALRRLHGWGGQPLPLNASACWTDEGGAAVRCSCACAARLPRCRRPAHAWAASLLEPAAAAGVHWTALRNQTRPWFTARDPALDLWRLSVPQTAPVLDLRCAAGRVAWRPALAESLARRRGADPCGGAAGWRQRHLVRPGRHVAAGDKTARARFDARQAAAGPHPPGVEAAVRSGRHLQPRPAVPAVLEHHPVRRLLHVADRHRTASTTRLLGWLLAFNAGAINAGGLLVVHMYTSHMSGFASQVADGLVLGNGTLVLEPSGRCWPSRPARPAPPSSSTGRGCTACAAPLPCRCCSRPRCCCPSA